MRKSHYNKQFIVLLGPIISRFFACSNEEKKPNQQSVQALVLSICPSLMFETAALLTNIRLKVNKIVSDKHTGLQHCIMSCCLKMFLSASPFPESKDSQSSFNWKSASLCNTKISL